MGKHVRPSKTAVVTGTATAGVLLAGAAVSGTPAVAAQPAAPPPKPAGLQALVVRAAPPPPVAHYRVKNGDTLSGIAQRFCGAASKWRQLWAANKGHIRNPDLIYPRELVRLACAAVARTVTPVATDPAPKPAVTVTGAQGVIGSQALRAIRSLVRERIDEGQDFSGTGPLYPVAPGTIKSTAPSGWPGSSYILEHLDAPVDGHGWVYYAEDITPEVRPGEHVGAGTVLGQVYRGGTGIEVGFGTSVPGVAAASGHYTDGHRTPEGEQMAALLAETAPPPKTKPHPPAFRRQEPAGSENGVAIYRYLRARGYNPVAAAGAVASMWGESAWDPQSRGMGGCGIMGWTPVRPVCSQGLRGQLPEILSFVSDNGDQAVIREMSRASTVTEAALEWGHGVERFGISDVHPAGVSLAVEIARAVDGVDLAA